MLRAGLSRWLGRVLIVGGVGYVISAFTAYLLPEATNLTNVLVVPATIGELWMIGHLLRGRGYAGPGPVQASGTPVLAQDD